MKPAYTYTILLPVIALLIFSQSCQKKENGTTTNTGMGSSYTVQVAGARNFHHVKHTSGPGIFTTDTLPDTTINIGFINDAEIKIGNELLFFMKHLNNTDTLINYLIIGNDFNRQRQLTYYVLRDSVVLFFSNQDFASSTWENFNSFK